MNPKAVYEIFKKTVADHELVTGGDAVLAGISGGPDSVCLLHLFLRLRRQIRFGIAVAHVDHGLRGRDAVRDERFVQELARRYSLPFHSIRFDVSAEAEKKKKGVEETARELRYRFFGEMVRAHRYTKVALGHHLDDQAETVLFRIIRGTGLRGLSGIPVTRRLEGTSAKIIRPLMNICKEDIIGYLKKNRLRYHIDRTNRSDRFMRNHIRNKLIPLMERINPAVRLHCANLAETARIESEYWDLRLQVLVRKVARREKSNIFLDLKAFNKYNILLRNRIIGLVFPDIADFGCIGGVIRLASGSRPGKRLSVPGGYFERTYSAVVYHPFPEKAGSRYPGEVPILVPGKIDIPGSSRQLICRIVDVRPLDVRSDRARAFVDWGKIKRKRLTLRFRREGDRFRPYGLKGSKKLKSFFADAKVPRPVRDAVPLVCADGGIVWVAGYRTDDRFRVTERTKKILEITIEE